MFSSHFNSDQNDVAGPADLSRITKNSFTSRPLKWRDFNFLVSKASSANYSNTETDSQRLPTIPLAHSPAERLIEMENRNSQLLFFPSRSNQQVATMRSN